MPTDTFFSLLADQGPWVILVFYLLWRDMQKDQALREVLAKNSDLLMELATMVRERLPRVG